MQNELISKIDDLKAKIAELKQKNINEAQTKEWLIRPFFEVLGWDFSNPNEVIPEDGDMAGRRCDYNFCINSNSKFLVEAKALNNNLDDSKMIIEKLNYCSNKDVPILIITNGNLYKIYFSELKGIGKEKLLNEFSLSDNINEDIIEKLCKSSFANDKLLNYAKKIWLYTIIKNASEQLFYSGNKPLINLINNIVKDNLGHKFGDKDIVNALKHFRLEINNDFEDIPNFNIENKKLDNNNKSDSNETIAEEKIDDDDLKIENHFDTKNPFLFELYNSLNDELYNNGLTYDIFSKKKYISLVKNKSHFCQIHTQKNRLKIWVNIEMQDIPEQFLTKIRDVSKVGHWGIGHIECVVKDKNDFYWLIPLIKIAYNK